MNQYIIFVVIYLFVVLVLAVCILCSRRFEKWVETSKHNGLKTFIVHYLINFLLLILSVASVMMYYRAHSTVGVFAWFFNVITNAFALGYNHGRKIKQ